MATHDLRQLMLAAYDAFDRGDRGFLIGLLAADVSWTMHGPPQAFPAPTVLRGKFAVVAALRKIDQALQVLENKLLFLMVDGDRAASMCDRTVLQRPTGRTLVYRAATFYRFQDGRLIEYQSFYDSFAMLEQVLGRELDVPAAYPFGQSEPLNGPAT